MKKLFTLIVFCFAFNPSLLIAQEAEPYYHRIGSQVFNPISPDPNSTGNSGTGANIDVVYHRAQWAVNPNDATKNITGTITTYFTTLTTNVTSLSFDLNKTS